MAFDATFFAFVGLVLFLALVVYLKVPGMMAKSLDERAANISKELDEAKRLREEAQTLLAEYQRKRKEAEAEAAQIVAVAEREAAALTEEARQKTEEFVARRNALSEQKIRQAEAERSAPSAPPQSTSPSPPPRASSPARPMPPPRTRSSRTPSARCSRD